MWFLQVNNYVAFSPSSQLEHLVLIGNFDHVAAGAILDILTLENI